MNLSFELASYQDVPMKNRVVFYHMPKAAGTWVKAQLEHAGIDTFNQTPHPTARLYMYGQNLPLSDKINGVETSILLQKSDPTSPGTYENALKLSTIRNPYDWMVSYYTHTDDGAKVADGWGNCNRYHGIKSFEEFVDKFTDPEFPWMHQPIAVIYKRLQCAQWFITAGGCEVQLAIRTERLAEGYNMLAQGLDIPALEPDQVPASHVHASPRRFKKDYRGYYDENSYDKVTTHFSRELQVFGYDFDGPTDDLSVLDISAMELTWKFGPNELSSRGEVVLHSLHSSNQVKLKGT